MENTLPQPQPQRHSWLKDFGGLLLFIVAVLVGTVIINTFVFRSFNVEGPSMEKTLYTGDRLIVDRLPVTWAELQNKQYIPNRGQIIVFKNPQYTAGNPDEYIVKRVIAFPGERVVLADGHYTVYNKDHSGGFNPDDANHGEPGSPTSGSIDVTVPDGTLFVSGDHRQGNYSYDSRNGLGYIPFYDVVGPVAMRIWPFTSARTF
jgi:signal peptidase I